MTGGGGDPPRAEVSERFQRDGHVMVRAALTGPVLRRARADAEAEVARVLAAPDEGARPAEGTGWQQEDYVGVLEVHRRSPALREVVCSPVLARLAAAALGVPAVRLLYDQLFAKPPGALFTPWHQDEVYWPVDTSQVIADGGIGTVRLWLSLTPLPASVGGLRFADGSHQLGAIDVEGSVTPSGTPATVVIDGNPVPVSDHGAFEAGDATLHAGYTLHGSRGNRSAQTRCGVTVAYVPDGARVAEPASWLQEVALALHTPGTRPGGLIDGPANPVLWSDAPGWHAGRTPRPS